MINGWTGFQIIKFAVPKDVVNGLEANNVVCGRVHIHNHYGKEEEVSDYVSIIVFTARLGAVMLCGVEGGLKG